MGAPATLTTEALTIGNHRMLWLLVDVPSGGVLDVALATGDDQRESETVLSVGKIGSTVGLQRVELSIVSVLHQLVAESGTAAKSLRLRFSAVGEQTLYSFGFE